MSHMSTNESAMHHCCYAIHTIARLQPLLSPRVPSLGAVLVACGIVLGVHLAESFVGREVVFTDGRPW